MKKFLQAHFALVFAVIISCAAAPPSCLAGELIDRIVATINGQIILQSDWDDSIRYAAFSDGRSVEQLTLEERKAALDRLIDQELLREQMRSAEFQHATTEEISKAVSDIRQRYAEAKSDEGWQAVLDRYLLTAQQVRENVAASLDLMRLADFRLRPSVSVDSKSIESYYNQELLPQLRSEGAKEPPLAEVTPTIKEVLTQRKINQLLTAWLENLRSGSDIRTENGSAGTMQ
jgi:peptidyl-prolyl cis-trans isomerase SurA